MKKPVSFGFFSALVMCPLIGVCQNHPSNNEVEASSVVQKFVEFDFQGYRLDSEGHQAIWKLTIEDGAPPENPVFVVKKFRIGSPQRTRGGSFRVPVDFEVRGLVTEGVNGLYFRRQVSVMKAVFPVQCLHDGCRIDLNRNVFDVSPHVGKEAASMWLKGLADIRQTAQEKEAALRLYEQVSSSQ